MEPASKKVKTEENGKGKVGFVIVGLGRAGTFHLNSLKAMSTVAVLRWVVDIDEERVKVVVEQEGCRGGKDLSEALADPAVDAVVIASVTNSHYGYIKQALEAGKAVFTEKPISHNPTQLQEITDMALRGKKAFFVGYQRRIDRNFRELHRQITSGAVGPLRLIKTCSRDNPLPPIEYLKSSGGVFYDMLCHDFDMIHFLSSGQLPEEVYSVGHCYNEEIRKFNDLDMVVVTMKFQSGLIATVDCSRIAPYGYDQRVEVFGEKGMASAQNEMSSTVIVGTAAGFHQSPCEWSFPQRYRITYTTELQEFVDLVRSNSVEPEASVRRHVDLDVVTAAAELSWRLGRPIKLTEVASLRHQLPH